MDLAAAYRELIVLQEEAINASQAQCDKYFATMGTENLAMIAMLLSEGVDVSETFTAPPGVAMRQMAAQTVYRELLRRQKAELTGIAPDAGRSPR